MLGFFLSSIYDTRLAHLFYLLLVRVVTDLFAL